MTSTEMTKDEAVEKARPITATQAKAAMAVVANDYDQLAEDLNSAAGARIAAVTEEVRAKYLAEGQTLIAHWADRMSGLRARFEAERAAMIREAEEQGVRIRPDEIRYSSRAPEVVGEGAEIESAVAGIRADLAAALDMVRRDRKAAERVIHVATLSAVTEEIVKGIPSAQEMFANAMTLRQQQEAERLRITSGGDL